MNILVCSQYCKSDRRGLNRIQVLQLLLFADPLGEMDYQTIDIQIWYLQEHLLIHTDNLSFNN